ncbi:unnamed protein product [Meganyctiphanes norvegica]|uniref:Uncharacterized protein n=1 Tax=Meganyctiphanes norvegica TaxID=48144 RepID=A0AAV2RZP8_MEGNR
MASTWLPAQAKENPGSSVLKPKQHTSLQQSHGLSLKQNEKKFAGDFGGGLGQQRSFGDISNRITGGRVVPTPNKQGLKDIAKKNYTQVFSDSTIPTQHNERKIKLEEPEFIPVIKEVEDYSDLLYPRLQLTDAKLNRISRIWERCQKPNLSQVDKTPSPRNDLSLETPISIREIRRSVHLEPVMDDSIFDLPPCWDI